MFRDKIFYILDTKDEWLETVYFLSCIIPYEKCPFFPSTWENILLVIMFTCVYCVYSICTRVCICIHRSHAFGSQRRTLFVFFRYFIPFLGRRGCQACLLNLKHTIWLNCLAWKRRSPPGLSISAGVAGLQSQADFCVC